MSGRDGTTRVVVAQGELEGESAGLVTRWLGVPYAAAPVGRLRFQAPEPVPAWSGVRSATEVGPAPIQPRTGPDPGLGRGTSEDCLYLNVWAPAEPGPPRPVMVWIHGGGYTTGSGAQYDGAALAALGDIVMVTINYRLGVLGFVDVGSVCRDPVPTNLGLRDQIAALGWVRDNIAAFGGDPDRVTVAGESAGSMSIALLTVASSAKGLFRAAIMQSGSFTMLHGPNGRDLIARRYADALGRSGGGLSRAGLADWQAVPADQLLAVQVAVDKAMKGTVPAAPWYDDDLLPASLAQARALPPTEIALLAGHNRDEITMFQYLPMDILPTRRSQLAARLRTALGAQAASRVLAAYPDTHRGNLALATDFAFAMPTRHFAERQAAAGRPTYVYRFDAATPVLGATHAAELPYLWDWSGLPAALLRGPASAAKRALGQRMQRHWVGFVRDGRPEPGWDPFTLPDRNTMIFHPDGDRMEADPDADRRAAWQGADVTPGI